MKVLLLLATIFVATNADISEILRGSNDLAGRYYHDTNGQYVHDDSGKYVHVDNPYVHVDNPYVHEVIPHDPYEHEHVPHPPYEHVHVPPLPYVHVDSPYRHVDVPHPPYEHVHVEPHPYVHEERTYLPPPTPPSGGYHYKKPDRAFDLIAPPTKKVAPRPVVTIAPRPVPTYKPAATTARPVVVPRPTVKGGGPYRWNLIHTGEHNVEHPEYNVKIGLPPHT